MFNSVFSRITVLRMVGVLLFISFLPLADPAFAVVAGDVDNSGTVNATDVQLVINGALGRPVAYSTDINHDTVHATNAVDVQLVIMAVLRLTIDKDGDGLCDAAEKNLNTDAQNPDTDGDGVSDGQEVLDGTDPLTPNVRTPPFSPVALFDNQNGDTPATGAPTGPTEVHLAAGALVAMMSTWHSPGIQVDTLSIRANDGTVFGPWPAAIVSSDAAAVQWQATPNIPLPLGVYTIVDSAPDSWLHNTGSGDAGFARLEGLVFSPAGSGTIGPAGGELLANGVRVTIPPGAFASDATLFLNYSDITEEGASSGAFILTGLPNGFGSFSVEMPAPGEPDGETEVFAGTQGYQYSRNQTTVDRTPLPATIAGGTLHFTIPAVSPLPEKGLEKAAAPTWLYSYSRFGKKKEALLSANGHFRLNANSRDLDNPLYQTYITSLAENLETAYDTLTTRVGLPFAKRTQWPILVELNWPWFSDAHAFAIRSYWGGRNSDYMEFNLYSVTDPALQLTVHAVTIHELFHLLQYNYVDPTIGAGAATQDGAGDRNWLMEASSTMSEWLACGNSYYPDVAQGNEGLFPLNGLLDAYTTEARDGLQARNPDYHGYSASVFLRFLWEAHNSPAVIGELWEHLGDGVPFTSAFDLACPAWKTDWRSYCRAAYGGELQRWRVGDGVIEMRTQSISQIARSSRPATVATMAGDSDTLQAKYSTGPLPPVSATLFQIDVKSHPTNPEDNTVYFMPEGLNADTTVQVRWFNPKPRSIAEWTSAVLGEVTAGNPLIVDLTTISDLPSAFVVQLIATNSSTSKTLPLAGVRWSFGSLLDRLHAMGSCRVVVDPLWTAPENQYAGGINSGIGPGPQTTEWSWNGTAFKAHREWIIDYDTPTNNYTRTTTWEITATMDAAGVSILAFTWRLLDDYDGAYLDEKDKEWHSTTYDVEETATMNNLPLSVKSTELFYGITRETGLSRLSNFRLFSRRSLDGVSEGRDLGKGDLSQVGLAVTFSPP